jgi:hypothetical protein
MRRMKRKIVKHSLGEYSYWGFQIRINPDKYYAYKIYKDGKYLTKKHKLKGVTELIDEIVNKKILDL